MSFCVHCGAQQELGDAFCSGCGRVVEERSVKPRAHGPAPGPGQPSPYGNAGPAAYAMGLPATPEMYGPRSTEPTTMLNFAPGETDVAEASFRPSVLLFWMRARIGVSSTRIVTKVPNTLLGVIPLGSADATYPLANVAGVGVNTRFSVGRLLFGLLLLGIGAGWVGDNVVAGVIFLALGVSMLSNVLNARLNIGNNGGGMSTIRVSIFEKAKLEQFREQINQRVFADHARLRHAEHIALQQSQLATQQAQLNAQLLHQQWLMAQQSGRSQSPSAGSETAAEPTPPAGQSPSD